MSVLQTPARPTRAHLEPDLAPAEPAWPIRTHVLIAVLALAGTTFALMQAIVVPALPKIQIQLATTASGAAWISTAYLLSACVLTPVVGRLGDTAGKKRMMLIVLAVFGMGTGVCAFAGNLPELVAGRLLQGSAGGIYPLAFAIIRERMPRERVAPSIGLVSSALGIGGGLGLVLPGPIMDELSYHWLFWLTLVPICASFALAARFIPADQPNSERVRIPRRSSALMAIGLSIVLIAVSESSTWHWLSPRMLLALVAGAVILAVWVGQELRSPAPLVNMALMRRRGVATANASAFALGVAMYASFFIIPELVQVPRRFGFGFGASVTMAGLFMFPTAASQLVLGPVSGLLHRRIGARRELLVGQLFCAAGFGTLAAWHTHPWQIYVGTAIIGIGFFLGLVALPNQIVETVPAASTGSATAVNTVVRNLGGALGGQLAAALILASTHAGVPGESGYVAALDLCATAALLGALAALASPRSHESRRASLRRPNARRVAERVRAHRYGRR
jgi:EmrB/QacA subfamily drug resistance transporter